MGLLINPADFTGKYELNIDLGTNVLIADCISKYEEWYLKQLMGATMFAAFKLSVASQVPTGIYLALYTPFDIDDDTCLPDDGLGIRSSNGLKEMLLGFIWFEFVRDNKYKHHKSGQITDKNENSREVSFDEANIVDKYNRAQATYEDIQWLIEQVPVTYPDYNGQKIEMSYWAL